MLELLFFAYIFRKNHPHQAVVKMWSNVKKQEFAFILCLKG